MSQAPTRKRSGPPAIVPCAYPRCPHRRSIDGADHLRAAVKTAAGLMHADCYAANTRLITALVDRAMVEGRHSDSRMHMCELCNNWVNLLMHRTLGGLMLCPGCALNAGAIDQAMFDRCTIGGVI